MADVLYDSVCVMAVLTMQVRTLLQAIHVHEHVHVRVIANQIMLQSCIKYIYYSKCYPTMYDAQQKPLLAVYSTIRLCITF